MDLVDTVFDVMRQMHQAVDRNLQVADYYGEGLNKSHILTLITLHARGSGSMTEIGRRVGLVKGAFSPLADRLLQLGYIEKTTAPADRRKVILALTARGEAYAERIRTESDAAFAANFARLNGREQVDFLRHLHGLSELLAVLNAK